MNNKVIESYLIELERIAQNNDLKGLSNLDMKLSIYTAYLYAQMGEMEVKKALFIESLPKPEGKKVPLKEKENSWQATQEGQQLTRAKRELQAAEIILKAAKNKLIIITSERRNLNYGNVK